MNSSYYCIICITVKTFNKCDTVGVQSCLQDCGDFFKTKGTDVIVLSNQTGSTGDRMIAENETFKQTNLKAANFLNNGKDKILMKNGTYLFQFFN